jgi:hypothetical protein
MVSLPNHGATFILTSSLLLIGSHDWSLHACDSFLLKSSGVPTILPQRFVQIGEIISQKPNFIKVLLNFFLFLPVYDKIPKLLQLI